MYYLGVDLGGTNIKAALVDADGAIIKEASTPTKLPRPAEAVCDDIAALCNQLAQGQQVAGIGVGCPGTEDGGIVRYSNNLGWHDFAMGDYLRAKTGLPVALANDANAAALGVPLGGLLAESFTYILQMPSLYFDVEVEPLSYVLSVLLAFGFTFIVNLATNRTLNKIDMVGALKSAE